MSRCQPSERQGSISKQSKVINILYTYILNSVFIKKLQRKMTTIFYSILIHIDDTREKKNNKKIPSFYHSYQLFLLGIHTIICYLCKCISILL